MDERYVPKYLNQEQLSEVLARHAVQAEIDWLNHTISARKAENIGNKKDAAIFKEAALNALRDLSVVESIARDGLYPEVSEQNEATKRTRKISPKEDKTLNGNETYT